MKALLSWFAAALALAAPASAHLLARGIPLSELAVTSPVAVSGRVESKSSDGADLLALVPAKQFGAADVARVAEVARRPETPATLAPGLVVLLAAIRIPEAEPALVAVLQSAPDPHTRAAAARVLGQRRGATVLAALRAAQQDGALAVRLTAQRA